MSKTIKNDMKPVQQKEYRISYQKASYFSSVFMKFANFLSTQAVTFFFAEKLYKFSFPQSCE